MLGVPSFPAAASPQRQGGRNKVALKPGRSLMDWVRFANGATDVQGFRGKINVVTPEELAKHCTEDDCWIAIRGRVYNATAYIEYHPGGVDELMKGAGKDATALFDEVHKWVNFDSMLSKCYIGPLKPSSTLLNKKVSKNGVVTKSAIKNDVFLVPTGPVPSRPSEVIPRFDWYEKEDEVNISVYTKTKLVTSSDLLLDCQDGATLNLKIFFQEKYYQIHLELPNRLKEAKVKSVNGNKIDITLTKLDVGLSWKTLGKGLQGHNQLHKEKARELTFRECKLVSSKPVTHDTKLYTFELPANVYYETPIGHHVIVKCIVGGMDIRRNYTVIDESLITTSENSLRGRRFHLMIKLYKDGAVTPVIHRLKEGDTLPISDCLGTFDKKQMETASHVYLIAAGTGFTPMVRLIRYLLFTSERDCKVKLLFANKTQRDMLWREQLDEMQKYHPNSFHVSHILSNPHASWEGLKGRIDENTLKGFLQGSNFEKSSFLNVAPVPVIMNQSQNQGLEKFHAICGPDEFTKTVERTLLSMGIKQDAIHCFLG